MENIFKIKNVFKIALILMLVLFSNNTNINAASMTQERSHKYIANDRSYSDQNDIPIMYLNINNIFAYCSEYSRPIADNKEYKAYSLNASQSVKNKLIYVLANGYPHNNLGLSKDEAIFATQMAVWNFYNKGVPFKQDNLVAKSGYQSLLSNAKTAANKLISSANSKAESFANVDSKVKITTGDVTEKVSGNKRIIGPYRVKLTDTQTNKIAVSFIKKSGNEYLSDSKGNAKSSFSANDGIYITTTDNTRGTGTIIVNATGYKYNLMAYAPVQAKTSNGVDNQDQILLSTTTFPVSDTATYSWTNVSGKLRIIKTDESNNRLSGVQFNLIDASTNKIVATRTTDSKGEILFDSLDAIRYKIVETKTIPGYILDSNPKFETVEKNNTINVYFVNKKENLKGSIELLKLGDDNIRLSGVSFNLIDMATNKLVASGRTNVNGIINFNNVPVGRYKLVETNTLSEYILDSSEKIVDVQANQTTKKQVINKRRKAEILVIKKDNLNYRLSGVEFELRNSNDNVVARGKTDYNGTLRFSDLMPGTYKVIETRTIDGYELDSTPKTVTAYSGQTRSVEITNYKITEEKYSITIVKMDSSTRQTLQGAVFNVYNLNNRLVDTITTNSRGRATTKSLPKGVYYFEEVKAPEGYISEEAIYDVNLSDRNAEKIVYNEKIVRHGFLRIVKLDKDTNKPLEGAKFDIYNSNGIVVDTVVTNSKGIALSKSLPQGTYKFVEVEAPEGYITDKTPYDFNLNENDNYVEKKVYNEKVIEQTASLKIIKLDKDTNAPLAGVKFELYNSKGKLIERLVTNAEGVILIEGLKIDNYTIKEVQGLKGYVVENYSKNIVFNKENLSETLIVYNEKVLEQTGKFKILKVDSKTKTPLEGAKFAIYDNSGKLVKEVVTNSEGIAYFYNLPIGKYTVKEIDAPKNYFKSTETINIEFTKDNLSIERTFENKKGELPQTGSFLSDNMKIVGKVSLVSMGAFLVIKNRNMFSGK